MKYIATIDLLTVIIKFKYLKTSRVRNTYRIIRVKVISLFSFVSFIGVWIMSKVKLNLIAAACENMGIGANGTLPWRLKKEMAYFTAMTTKVSSPEQVNAVIMGRITWDCIPEKYRPLPNRVNIVMTRHVDNVQDKVPEGVVVVPSLDEAIKYIEGRSDIERTWVIGGSSIYQAAMAHPNCGKIYLTEIQKTFDCDTFFPNISKQFHLVNEEDIPGEKQVEGDISYFFRVYKRL